MVDNGAVEIVWLCRGEKILCVTLW